MSRNLSKVSKLTIGSKRKSKRSRKSSSATRRIRLSSRSWLRQNSRSSEMVMATMRRKRVRKMMRLLSNLERARVKMMRVKAAVVVAFLVKEEKMILRKRMLRMKTKRKKMLRMERIRKKKRRKKIKRTTKIKSRLR